MEYLTSLIWVAAWPVLIFVFYRLSFILLKQTDYLYGDDEQ